jgi:hypothetical protein
MSSVSRSPSGPMAHVLGRAAFLLSIAFLFAGPDMGQLKQRL